MITYFLQNQKVLERYGVQPGHSVLLLNGMLIDLESADPFTCVFLLSNSFVCAVQLNAFNQFIEIFCHKRK